MRTSWLILGVLSVGWAAGEAPAQPVNPLLEVRAELRPVSYHFAVGQPVWVRFTIENLSDDAVTLQVPGTEPEIPSPESGLPHSHVFSGGNSSGVAVLTEAGRRLDQPVGHRPEEQAPILIVGPHSSVGSTLDLREYFPVLRGAGRYRIEWQPYRGLVSSHPVVLTVAALKLCEIVTDDGAMMMRFFYEDAPSTVANFIELAKSGFYSSKVFHRIEPGYLIQGGCPRGDGTGIRLDGKRIPAEFNGRIMDKGRVAMALLNDDPDSASCQFFICNTRQKDWDGRYTVFGELVGEESFATLERLMNRDVDEQGRPLDPLYMRSVRIIDAPSDALP
ncbi:MAG: peptidylprolyl isomerase [Phycisphaerae bacterium]|jgi:cyclophilin family peptidyl-prolyl cis-trans isomerase